MGRNRFAPALIAASVASLSSPAWAQDYTKTNSSGLLESRPAGATHVASMTGANGTVWPLHLPFLFPYYGTAFQDLTVTTGGYLLPRTVTTIQNMLVPNVNHGQDATSRAFPYTQTGVGGAGSHNVDGLIAPRWTGGYICQVYAWTSGAAPTRHFVVSWENFDSGSPVRVTFQVHLYEGNGRIVFAYDPASTWVSPTGSSPGFACGLDFPIDARFTAPLGSTPFNVGYPGADFVFDPVPTTFTGTLLYDKMVSDATGIGNSVSADQPLSGARVELRRGDGIVLGSATTGADGAYSVSGRALQSTSSGALFALAQNDACAVGTTAGGTSPTWTLNGSLSFAAGANLGTQTLSAGADSLGDLRASFNVARVCLGARDWAAARTSAAIPRLDVLVDATSGDATRYVKADAPSAAYLRIGSRSALNPDVWDDAVITRTYARHVLASIAAPASTYDDRFDAVTDAQNAFAEGFGLYLWSAISGSVLSIDGLGASSASVRDLESPTLVSVKGPHVAGRLAAALHDLLDPANETGDDVDGAAAPERVLEVADALTVAPTAANFLQAWVDAGLGADGITRVYIRDGVLPDDAGEPDDSLSDALPAGEVGVVRRSLVLNRFNQDWISVTLAADAPGLMADVKYDAVSTGAVVELELRDHGGALLASATTVGPNGAVHAVVGPVPAGTYRVGVKHVSGGTIPAYTLQAYVPLSLGPYPVLEWTIGRDYDRPLGAVGGIAPFLVSSSTLPPGLSVDPTTLRVVGNPQTYGDYVTSIALTDDGDPANVAYGGGPVRINDFFKIPLPGFVGFPAGRSVDVSLPSTGGTRPFAFLVATGALPPGLEFEPSSLRVMGTSAAVSSALEIEGVDAAGSSDQVATRAVVAVQVTGKSVPAELAAGDDACGWWFDAVKGSQASFSIATTKHREKRALAGAVLAPDRSVVETGPIRSKAGRLAVPRFVCPSSGRYYVVASSVSGEATQLRGSLRSAPPKSGRGGDKAFQSTETTTIEVGALPGATLRLSFAGDRKSELVARVQAVVDPGGTSHPFADFVKSSSTGGTLTMPLASGGTWRIVLSAQSPSGRPGRLAYSYVIRQPRRVAYSAD